VEGSLADEGGGAGDAESGASPAPALTFGETSGDVALPMAGTFDVALIAFGSVACRSPRLVAHVTLDPGVQATVAIMGLAAAEAGSDSELSLVAFADEPSTSTAAARVRFVHAALGAPSGGEAAPPLAIRIAGQPVALEVDPRRAATPSRAPPVDLLGYATVAPTTAPTEIRLDSVGDASTATWSTAGFDFGLSAGTVHSGFVVDVAPDALGPNSLGIVWCTAPAALDAGVSCQIVPAPAN
jgi:hypothetical protein